MEKITFKTIWHEAGISGLVLAAICSAYFVINTYAGQSDAAWLKGITFVAEVAKIWACIYLMRLYMTRFKAEYPGATHKDVFRLGLWMGVLSGIILAAVNMIYYTWNPEVVRTAMDTAIAALPQAPDRNTLDIIEKMEGNFPQIAFVSNLLYCTLWAVILPAILAPGIANGNPFENEESDEQ